MSYFTRMGELKGVNLCVFGDVKINAAARIISVVRAGPVRGAAKASFVSLVWNGGWDQRGRKGPVSCCHLGVYLNWALALQGPNKFLIGFPGGNQAKPWVSISAVKENAGNFTPKKLTQNQGKLRKLDGDLDGEVFPQVVYTCASCAMFPICAHWLTG